MIAKTLVKSLEDQSTWIIA